MVVNKCTHVCKTQFLLHCKAYEDVRKRYFPSFKQKKQLFGNESYFSSFYERENIHETGYGCSPATRRSQSNIISWKKRRFTGIIAGKLFPFSVFIPFLSLSQSQRYVFEVSCCVFERPIMYPVPYNFWLFLIKRLCWLIVCHSSEADVSIISQYPDF